MSFIWVRRVIKYVDGITSQGKNEEAASFIQKWLTRCFPINFQNLPSVKWNSEQKVLTDYLLSTEKSLVFHLIPFVLVL